MDDKKRNWIRIAESVAELIIPTNGVIEVDANGKIICVAQQGEQLFAFAQKCPHAGGYFVHGSVDAAGNVVCPLHRYKFCVKNGRNVSGEGYYLKHWPVEIREDGVYVGMESSPWSFL